MLDVVKLIHAVVSARKRCDQFLNVPFRCGAEAVLDQVLLQYLFVDDAIACLSSPRKHIKGTAEDMACHATETGSYIRFSES